MRVGLGHWNEAGEYMQTFFMLKNFKQWLKQNKKRFTHPPFITNVTRNGFGIRFTGIDPRFCCYVGYSGSAVVWVRYGGQSYDIIMEFDVIPRKDAKGKYHCYLCRIEDPTSATYASRTDLVTKHTWEPLLEWINENTTASKVVCVYGMGGGSTWAKIMLTQEIEQEQANSSYVDSFPVVRYIVPIRLVGRE